MRLAVILHKSLPYYTAADRGADGGTMRGLQQHLFKLPAPDLIENARWGLKSHQLGLCSEEVTVPPSHSVSRFCVGETKNEFAARKICGGFDLHAIISRSRRGRGLRAIAAGTLVWWGARSFDGYQAGAGTVP